MFRHLEILYHTSQYKIALCFCLCYIYHSVFRWGNWLTVYSYNKLWKMLIDRKITKTQMQQQADISTNMLAKMGKDEPVSMETLAKISTVFGCGLDDIVEIFLDKTTEAE